MSDGAFLYDARTNLLKAVAPDDIRALTGRQDFAKDAPVNLIFVSDLSRMTRAAPADRDFYAAAHAGFIDRPALARALRLRPDQKITLAQTVGYPKR
jgi:hypothetical protein